MTPQEISLINHRLYEIQAEVHKLEEHEPNANPVKLIIQLREDLRE